MKESAGYQMILEEGEILGMRRMIHTIGSRRFGGIPPEVESRLNGIEDVAHLERISHRLLDAADWNDLLNTP